MRDTIDMAREAGGVDVSSKGWTSWVGTQSTEFLERLVALVRADEREANAKQLDALGCGHCAAAIRNRENT